MDGCSFDNNVPCIAEKEVFAVDSICDYLIHHMKENGAYQITDPALLEMAKVYRLPLGKRLRYIWLPGMFPSFCESCIAAMGMCWKSGVSAEVIGLPDHSVGDALYRAKITISTPEVFAWTLVIVLLSATLSTLAAWALRRAKRALCGEVEG